MCFCICDLFWFLAESLVPKKKWNQVTRWVGYDFAKKMDELWHTMTNHVFEGTNRSIRDGTSRNSSLPRHEVGLEDSQIWAENSSSQAKLAVWCRIFSLKMEDLHSKKPPWKGSRGHGFPVPMTALPAQFVWVSGSQPQSWLWLHRKMLLTATHLVVSVSSWGNQSSPWLLTYTKSLRHPRRLDDLGYPHGLETYIWDISSGSWDSMVPPGWCLLVCNRH